MLRNYLIIRSHMVYLPTAKNDEYAYLNLFSDCILAFGHKQASYPSSKTSTDDGQAQRSKNKTGPRRRKLQEVRAAYPRWSLSFPGTPDKLAAHSPYDLAYLEYLFQRCTLDWLAWEQRQCTLMNDDEFLLLASGCLMVPVAPSIPVR